MTCLMTGLQRSLEKLMSFTIRFEPSEEFERDPDVGIVSKMYWKPQSVQRRSKGERGVLKKTGPFLVWKT